MSRPDIEGIGTRLQGWTKQSATAGDIVWLKRDLRAVLDYVEKLEAELEGHRRQDSGYMKRAIEAQGG